MLSKLTTRDGKSKIYNKSHCCKIDITQHINRATQKKNIIMLKVMKRHFKNSMPILVENTGYKSTLFKHNIFQTHNKPAPPNEEILDTLYY